MSRASHRSSPDGRTVRERLLASSNDYTALEERYRQETGAELVTDPFAVYGSAAPELNRTAAVVIASYNSIASLELSLRSIEASTFNENHSDLLQVVVVDDGSTDGTREMVTALDLDLNLRYVRQDRAGVAAAHNTGVAFCDSDVVIFADSDIVHLPYGIEELMKRHQLLDGVVLIGFQFQIDPRDPRLDRQAFRSNLGDFYPDFPSDFRLSFPGRPGNMCRESGHLKRLGFGRTLMMSNGAQYNLPAMVVGALFSVERPDFEAIGGSDERIRGWGCEDSLIGARCIALGNFVVPVYGAASAHVSHPPRDATQTADFQRNLARVEAILDEDWEPPRRFAGEQYRRRATEHRDVSVARGGVERPALRSDYSNCGGDIRRWGDYYSALGRYREAIASYENAMTAEPGSYWARLGIAKAKRELGDQDATDAFDEVVRVDSANPWGCFEASLAFAGTGDTRRAGALMACAAGLFEHEWTMRLGSEGHKRRGNHHAAQEMHEAAVTDFALATIVDPSNAWAHFDRGTSLRALGRRDDAVAAVSAATALMHPNDAARTWPLGLLAELHLDAGRVNQAQLHLDRALELYAENGPAAATQSRLSGQTEAASHLHVVPSAHEAVESIPGWLAPDEAALLAGVASLSLERHPMAALLELGSYCGKSTAVIAGAIRKSGRRAVLVAVDPHENQVPAGGDLTHVHLRANLTRLRLHHYVEIVRGRSLTVPWSRPVGMLFIDALHDYENVAADFARFSRFVLPGGLVAFHDYSGYWPGVKRLVNEVLTSSEFRYLSQRGAMIVLERAGPSPTTSPN